MKPIKTLLLGTDFSACSEPATDHAIALAQALGAQLLIVHVTELPPSVAASTMVRPEGAALSIQRYVAEAAERSMGPLRARCAAAELHPQTFVELGPVPETLLALAQRHGAQLIVVGTHGRTGLRHLLLGSVAEHLLRLSPLPVLSVRGLGADAIAAEDAQVIAEAEG